MVSAMLRDPWRSIGVLGLLTLAAPCQQLEDRSAPEPRRDAIQATVARLATEEFDRDALLAVIDAGDAAVLPLIEALDHAVREARGPPAERIGRALRAIGVPAARENEPVLEILRRQLTATPAASNPALDALVETLSELAWQTPDLVPRLAASFDDLEDPLVQTLLHVRERGYLRLARRITVPEDPNAQGLPDARFDAEILFDRELAACMEPHRASPDVRALVAALHADSQPGTCQFRMDWGVIARGITPEGARVLVRDAAARSLARIDPDHPEAALGLALLAADAPDPRERLRAMVALGQRGDVLADDAEIVEVIYQILGDRSDQRLCGETITACGASRFRSKEIRARLEQLAADPNPELAARAKSVLARPERR